MRVRRLLPAFACLLTVVALLASCGGNGGRSHRPAGPGATETNCQDGVDNDGGGGTDCLDSDCASNNNCTCVVSPTPANDPDGDGIPNQCDNCESVFNPQHSDADDDGFGDACDCNDGNPAVHPGQAESTSARCNNGLDDDCDGDVDCNDSDCTGISPCAPPVENCCNNADDDDDGLTDELDVLDCPNQDGDSAADVCETCDGDPQKTAPGQCGCGVPDVNNDTDTVADCNDNCDTVPNQTQLNSDGDAFGNSCDPCPNDPDNDADGDGVCAGIGFLAPKTGDRDNCPDQSNANQADADDDDFGDACDTCPNDPGNDADNDGDCGSDDNCPNVANSNQSNADGDDFGDACDSCPDDADNDGDADGICAGTGFTAPKTGDDDNCPDASNSTQVDSDGDGPGDACDVCRNDPDDDVDGDGICAGVGFLAPKTDDQDNCPDDSNASQGDGDGDGAGNACDGCPGDADNDSDNDGICEGTGFLAPEIGDQDNCPDDANAGQEDADGDDFGDACDICQGDDASGDADGDLFCDDVDCDDDGVLNDCESACDDSNDNDTDGVEDCADPDCHLLECSNNKCCNIADGSCTPQNCS